ncbi:hypothetical protein D3C86_1881520 [compost metagenome]
MKGMYADFSILSEDYFAVPADKVRYIESDLTVVNGKIVYGARDFKSLDPAIVPVIPDWSPVKYFGGYAKKM